MSKNPYGRAADAYSGTAAETDPRAMEGRVLQKSAQKLEDMARRLQGGENVHFKELGETLEHNQKIWTILVGDMADPAHLLPQSIKDNIASLGIYVFKRTQDIMIEPKPEKFKILIDINRNIAAGLLKQPVAPPDSLKKPGAPVSKAEALKDTDNLI